MAKFAKVVNRGVPGSERSQVFTDSDVSSADILDFITTLGRPARNVRIETAGSSDLTIRRNVCQTVFPQRTEGIFDGALAGQAVNVADGREYVDESIAAEEAGPSLELNGPIKDLEVVGQSWLRYNL